MRPSRDSQCAEVVLVATLHLHRNRNHKEPQHHRTFHTDSSDGTGRCVQDDVLEHRSTRRRKIMSQHGGHGFARHTLERNKNHYHLTSKTPLLARRWTAALQDGVECREEHHVAHEHVAKHDGGSCGDSRTLNSTVLPHAHTQSLSSGEVKPGPGAGIKLPSVNTQVLYLLVRPPFLQDRTFHPSSSLCTHSTQ